MRGVSWMGIFRGAHFRAEPETLPKRTIGRIPETSGILDLKSRSNNEIKETEQKGIYRGKTNILLRGIYVKLTYIINKALGIFWKVSTLKSLRTCLSSLSIIVKT
jgi:hypothetical protein